MYKALYRKYRPTVFSDVVGQEHITTTLTHQVATGNFSHAYLFAGSRGTGKTTCAKILARAINCENPQNGNPCDKCENCVGILNESIPDVIEMDAASNRKIDDIREIRDRIAYAPAKTKYKVYIVDEVHMLTPQAANALLKTLEEPPAHAVFILATTEVDKILPTIISRCQRFDFHRIEPSVIASRLATIASSEGLTLEQDAALLIAQIADGGMRDAISILDLCAASSTTVTAEIVNNICGRASSEYLFNLSSAICENDGAGCLKIIAELHKNSVDMGRLCNELSDFWRNITLLCSGVEAENVFATTKAEAQKYIDFAKNITVERALHYASAFCDATVLMQNGNRRSVLEMAIIKLTNPRLDTSPEAVLSRLSNLESKISSGSFTAYAPKSDVAPAVAEKPPTEKPQQSSVTTACAITPPVTVPESEDQSTVGKLRPMAEWSDILDECSRTAPLFYSILHGSKGYLKGDKIIIRTSSSQVRETLLKKDDMRYKGLVQAIITVMGRELTPIAEKEEAIKKDDPLLGFENLLNNL